MYDADAGHDSPRGAGADPAAAAPPELQARVLRGTVPDQVLRRARQDANGRYGVQDGTVLLVQYCELLHELTLTAVGDVPHSDARHNAGLELGALFVDGLHQGEGGVATIAELSARLRDNVAGVLAMLESISDAGWGLCDLSGEASLSIGVGRIGYPGPQATSNM